MPIMHPVESSTIVEIGYERDELESDTIFVKFRNGWLYKCYGTEIEYNQLRANPSAKKGGYFETNIKPRLKRVT